ncbi:hypothetical protein H6F86_20980 [Phormidium sp. FACHB-592]|uniref:Uncharacterized protein n=1 Tax=Stenomitos frigidus AS-A4 TaxID=2933935 RepID=A0ABV0KEP5_9CYAN|nr:hypothetical protein [Phormidium sp. FACHB-592]MBD2076309.1 hypothetical protein [Phormidium sp. FACHB-592]
MKTLDSLTVEIVLVDGKLTAVCRDIGVTVKGEHLFGLLRDSLTSCVDDKLFALHESGNLKINAFVKALIGAADALNGDGIQEWLYQKRWEKHQEALKTAFHTAYPVSKNHIILPSPYHDHEDEEWDKAKEKAELGLIANGKHDPDWVLYCQVCCGSKYFEFGESSRDRWYQSNLDLGLPLLPIDQIKAMYKKHGWKAFDFDAFRLKQHP